MTKRLDKNRPSPREALFDRKVSAAPETDTLCDTDRSVTHTFEQGQLTTTRTSTVLDNRQ